MPRTAPYGSWRSPLSADRLAQGARRLSQPRLRGGDVYWVEGRPDEGGRQHVRRARPGGRQEAMTPADANVRSQVHEYGGGDYGFVGDELVYVQAGVAGIQRVGGGAVKGTLARARYADLVGSPDGRWLVAVEEEARDGQEPANRLVAFELAGGRREVLVGDHDFVAQPAFSATGDRLVCIVWDHPRLPWDGTELLQAAWSAEGPAGSMRRLAGGPDEALFQPGFGVDGSLYVVSDRSGWWNLDRITEHGAEPIAPRAAEFGRPLWVFGLSTWAPEDADHLLCIVSDDGRDELVRLDLRSGSMQALPCPFDDLEGLRVEGRAATFLGASAERAACVCRVDLDRGTTEVLGSALDESFDPLREAWSRPEAIDYPSAEGRRAHAFLYRPHHPEVEGPKGETPPLIVKTHGGPTAATTGSLRLPIQYWTTRGFAVLDVNYAGSTGYGRAYRNALRGKWGVADVDDCEAGARHVATEGLADPMRLVITGGSAGGYTTLCALTFRETFAAGASHYGIGDLETLVRDTHKFEARYLDGLIGPYPEAQALYRERSPIHSADRLSCPVIFLQGGKDRVVPPNQADDMARALAERGIPHAHVLFPEEGHGFRVAANIRRALESELAFYGQVFGFETPGVPAVTMRGGASRG